MVKDKNSKLHVLEYIALILAIFSLLVAIRGCQISNDAKKIAKDSLDVTKNQFVQINRPYIILAPKKFNNGQFWKIEQDKNRVIATLRYEIKNVGNVAAKNIEVPTNVIVANVENKSPIYYQKSGKITLGPGDKMNLTLTSNMGYESEAMSKANYEYLISDKSEGVIFHLSVDYESEVDKAHKYRTYVENRIHNEKALLIKSEMLTTVGNEDR